MRRTLAVLLGLGLALPTLLHFLLKWALVKGWLGVIWLAGPCEEPADQPAQAQPLIVHLSDRDLWWAGEEPDWQERKH